MLGILYDIHGNIPALGRVLDEAAEGAKENCPVSQALKGNVEITLDASLG